jgi:glyoxylase I family protein
VFELRKLNPSSSFVINRSLHFNGRSDSRVSGTAFDITDAELAGKLMPEIIGIDHIYVAVSDLRQSEAFYDRLMPVLRFRKNSFQIDGTAHIQYFNRHLGYVLRPARSTVRHDPYAPGLHHFCFRVEGERELREIALRLLSAGVTVTEPRLYPEYAPDYIAIFFADPDGIRLEITNYRDERRYRHDHWRDLGNEP